MPRTEQKTDFSICRYATAAFLFFVLLTAVAAQAQIFEVLHTFAGRGDGENPYAGLTLVSRKILRHHLRVVRLWVGLQLEEHGKRL